MSAPVRVVAPGVSGRDLAAAPQKPATAKRACTCSICGRGGHNARACSKAPVKPASKAAAKPAAKPAAPASEHRTYEVPVTLYVTVRVEAS